MPILKEDAEGRIILKIEKRIDDFLWNVLPDEIYDLCKTAADGITTDEAENLKSRLSSIINKYIDLPFLSEKTEKELFDFVISLVCDALKKGVDLGMKAVV
ncbi:MAG: hypothetical protein PQJ35_05940 [Sphaerochaetaceae bacterium]|nr:hypothetical protein [Sphaerochaetaceae bacterium]